MKLHKPDNDFQTINPRVTFWSKNGFWWKPSDAVSNCSREASCQLHPYFFAIFLTLKFILLNANLWSQTLNVLSS